MKLCAHAQLSSLGNETVKLGKLKGDSEFPTELKRIGVKVKNHILILFQKLLILLWNYCQRK